MRMPGFEEWESFYVIVGAAAGALIGLQFVVMTLMGDRPMSAAASAAFSTPQIVHFSAVLLFAGIHNAWDAVTYHMTVRRRVLPPDGKPHEAPTGEKHT